MDGFVPSWLRPKYVILGPPLYTNKSSLPFFPFLYHLKIHTSAQIVLWLMLPPVDSIFTTPLYNIPTIHAWLITAWWYLFFLPSRYLHAIGHWEQLSPHPHSELKEEEHRNSIHGRVPDQDPRSGRYRIASHRGRKGRGRVVFIPLIRLNPIERIKYSLLPTIKYDKYDCTSEASSCWVKPARLSNRKGNQKGK